MSAADGVPAPDRVYGEWVRLSAGGALRVFFHNSGSDGVETATKGLRYIRRVFGRIPAMPDLAHNSTAFWGEAWGHAAP